MRRSPDKPPEEGDDYERHRTAGAEAIELMRRLHGVLGACPLDTAFEALGNMMVLLAVAASSSKKEAHEVIDDEWPAMHVCLDINYESAVRLQAAIERQGAVVH